MSVALRVPVSLVEVVAARERASVALRVPVSVLVLVVERAEVSVADSVPESFTGILAVMTMLEVSVALKVPVSLEDTGVAAPIGTTDADSVADTVPVSEPR